MMHSTHFQNMMPQGSRVHKCVVEIVQCVFNLCVFISPETDTRELRADFWNNKGRQALFTAMNVQPNTKKAKNMILFIGDGESEQFYCK